MHLSEIIGVGCRGRRTRLLPYSDTFIDIRQHFAPPFAGPHILGTDPLGRDILARLLMAGRISLSAGFCAMVLAMGIGIAVGVAAGFHEGVGPLIITSMKSISCSFSTYTTTSTFITM
ncbi:MAG: hypothetical protein B7Z14_14550 [Bosea sp. 32-68-6]|nr:MAG: hypothetical protein B7Z14_14550 [Bosea sp. 32-68-6]